MLEQFYRIFDDFLDGVMILNDQKEILYLNSASENLFKLTSLARRDHQYRCSSFHDYSSSYHKLRCYKVSVKSEVICSFDHRLSLDKLIISFSNVDHSTMDFILARNHHQYQYFNHLSKLLN